MAGIEPQFSKEKKALLFLFFASGISGLIYEVVWLRMLSRVLGVTTYAAAITLAAFMAGLGIGAYVFGKVGDKNRDLLGVYTWLQVLIGLAAVITPLLFDASVGLYRAAYSLSGHSNAAVMALRAVISFITLLVPATLMGGTLPIITSYITKKDNLFGSNLSVLYGVNTLGAVLGVLLSGFITIGFFGEWQSIFLGVAVNLMVAYGIIKVSGKTAAAEATGQPVTPDKSPMEPGVKSGYPDKIRKFVLAAVLVSGFTSLAYEVIWTRQLILYLNVSIYAFSAMLAVFLTGVATGSLVINRFINGLKHPLLVFGALEMVVGVLSLVNLLIFPVFDYGRAANAAAPFILVFPITFVFGMVFPLAVLCYTNSFSKAGSSIGAVYGMNTLGNVLGSLVTGFILIGLMGSTMAIILLGSLNVVIGLALVWLEPGRPAAVKLKYALIAPLALFLALAAAKNDIFLDVIQKRIFKMSANSTILFNKECTQGTVTSFILEGQKGLSVNGIGQTRLCTETELMAHLPVLLADKPAKFLVICFGMGTIVKSAYTYDNMRIDAVELVPELFGCFKYYHDNAGEILKSKRFRGYAEDGRNFLLLSDDLYDCISVDPSPPVYSAGTVNLYTKEFFTLCKEHLSPKGIMCMWFPGAGIDDEMMILKTFVTVFPKMLLWGRPQFGGFFMTGGLDDIKVDVSKFDAAYKDKKFLKDVTEYGNRFDSSEKLFSILSMDGEEVSRMTAKYPVITDNHPYTEFPLFR